MMAAALLVTTAAGCARQAVRPPSGEGLEPAAREQLFRDFRLVEERRRHVNLLPPAPLEASVFRRADGVYAADRLRDVFQSFPESAQVLKENARSAVRWAWWWAGTVAAGVAADTLLVNGMPPGLPHAAVTLLGAGVVLPMPRLGFPVGAYNEALARSLGVTATAFGPGEEAGEPPAWPSGLYLSPELTGGVSVQSRDDFEQVAGPLDWDDRRPPAPGFYGLGLTLGGGRRLTFGVDWVPNLPKRATITYANGVALACRFDASTLIGRIRLLVPLRPTLNLTAGAGVGKIWLHDATVDSSVSPRYWELIGDAVAGTAEIGLERLLARGLSQFLTVGYRSARIARVTRRGAAPVGEPVDGTSEDAPSVLGGRLAVDHSGPVIAVGWRYYFSYMPGASRGAGRAE